MKHNKGFSLVELLLVLGVIAVLLIASFIVYPRVKSSMNASKEIHNISMIQAGLVRFFESKGNDYKALGAATEKTGNIFANNAKLIPNSMLSSESSSGQLVNAWGGEVVIFATTATHNGYGAGKAFAIRYTSVPPDACIKMTTEAANSFTNIQVSRSNLISKNTLNLDSTISLCNAAGADGAEITFISR